MAKSGKKLVRLFRYLQSGDEPRRSLHFPFRDEYGKISVAKYKIMFALEGHLKDHFNYIYRLDGRSVRMMRRVEIIENTVPGSKKPYEIKDEKIRPR